MTSQWPNALLPDLTAHGALHPLFVVNIRVGASSYAHNAFRHRGMGSMYLSYFVFRQRYGWYVYSLSCMYDGGW